MGKLIDIPEKKPQGGYFQFIKENQISNNLIHYYYKYFFKGKEIVYNVKNLLVAEHIVDASYSMYMTNQCDSKGLPTLKFSEGPTIGPPQSPSTMLISWGYPVKNSEGEKEHTTKAKRTRKIYVK